MQHGSDVPSEIDGPGGSGSTFTTDTAGLPDVTRPEVVRLKDGDRFAFRIGPVRKRLDDADLRMLAYNGSIPGPTLHVDQGSEITVDVTNDGDVEATVHWHGLRLENRYDGVPHETQAPIAIGETFTLQGAVPGRRLLLVPPAYPRGLRARDGSLRHDRRRTLGCRVLAPGRPPPHHHAGRPARRGRAHRCVQHGGAELHRDGAVRERHADQRRAVVLRRRLRPARSSACTSSTPRTRGSSTWRSPGRAPNSSAATAAGTSGRRSSTRCCSRRPSEPSSTCSSTRPGRSSWNTARPSTSYDLGGFTVDRRSRRRCGVEPSRRLRMDPELTAVHRGDRARPRASAGQGAGVLLEDAPALRRRRGRCPTSVRCTRR